MRTCRLAIARYSLAQASAFVYASFLLALRPALALAASSARAIATDSAVARFFATDSGTGRPCAAWGHSSKMLAMSSTGSSFLAFLTDLLTDFTALAFA